MKKTIISFLSLLLSSQIYAHDIQTKYLRIVNDESTSCEYVLTDTQILPRLNIEHKHICDNSPNKKFKGYLKAIIITDTETGCEYISSTESSGLTVRLNKDGQNVCQRN